MCCFGVFFSQYFSWSVFKSGPIDIVSILLTDHFLLISLFVENTSPYPLRLGYFDDLI